jgi:uncharacterized protein (DUF1697 family)
MPHAALAAELERAIAGGIGVRARAVVLSREDLARCLRDNPYPGETNLHTPDGYPRSDVADLAACVPVLGHPQ